MPRRAGQSSTLLLFGLACALVVHLYMLTDVGVGAQAPPASAGETTAPFGHAQSAGPLDTVADGHGSSHIMTAMCLAILVTAPVLVAVRPWALRFRPAHQDCRGFAAQRRRGPGFMPPARARPSSVDDGILLLI
ncbi:MAG: hypothetical protein ACRD0K_12455 [Egibacteraceae bacterium]